MNKPDPQAIKAAYLQHNDAAEAEDLKEVVTEMLTEFKEAHEQAFTNGYEAGFAAAQQTVQ